MSVISGGSDYDRLPFGSSPSSVVSYPINQDYPGGAQSVMSSAVTAANSILPPEQANINFKPTTTAVTKISKLKLHVLLDSTIYTAGGILTGRLALTSSTARSIKLGEISVELTAFEELSVKEYTASQSFLSSRLVFQSENLPPSNAVHGPKDNGYWTAKKGKTTFPFAFKIPVDAPSSVTYASLASLKYVVTGVVQFFNNNKADTLFKSKEALIVEAWDGQNPIYKQPVNETNMKQLWMGGSGAVTLEGTLSETLFQSGGNVSVQVRVKNETKRRVQGIKVAITHKLLILANKHKKEIDDVKVVGDTITEEWFKNKDFLFDCGEDRSTTIHMNVPRNARTIRNTALFEVVCFIVVSLYLGPFTKDLTVHLPVYIAHSASLQPAPIADADLNVFPNHYNMMDENAEFFVEDTRQDDDDVLGLVSTPVNIPKKGGRVLPWSNEEDDSRGHYSPAKGSAGSYIFGSASPKKLGSFASSLLGRPKQMSPPNPSKLIAKSPPLAPASPYAYIPAIERVRYLSFSTQEQGAIQKRPFAATSGLGGIGQHNGSQVSQVSPPTSEYEFINAPSEPSKNIQTWLDKQQNDNQSEGSSPALSEGSEPVVTPSGKSPWAHINQTQEIANSQDPTQNFDFSSESFKRTDNIASSPPGPSGLTLLMKQKAQMPRIQDNMFEDIVSTTSNDTYGAYENVPKGRPLPTPTPKPKEPEVNNEKKPDFVQVPGLEQEKPKSSNTNDAVNGGGNLSSLFKWGTSWIGYGNGGSNNQSQTSFESNEKTLLQNIEENTSNENPKNRPRRQLPPPPTTTTTTAAATNNITDNASVITTQDENQVPKTRPRRSLPAPPSSVPQMPITPNNPIIEEEENTSNYISNSPPRNDITKPLNVEQINKITPVTTEQKSPLKVTSPEQSSPPKRSYLAGIPINKASIFAALGQKPLGMSSTPPPAPVVSPKKASPVVLSTSPPKQFNVKRKPVELNSLLKNNPEIEMIKNELKASENSNEIENSNENIQLPTTNKVTSPTKYKLAIPPPVPQKSISKSTKATSVTSPIPIDNKNNETNSSIPIDNKNNETNSSIPIDNKNNETNSSIPIDNKNNETNSSIPIDNKNNETNSSIPIDNKNNETNSPIPIDDKNNETKLSPPNSPIDPKKVLAAPTTYINTTIAKPIVASNEKNNLEERLLITNNNNKKKRNNENTEEEGKLTAKITEPPKSVLSPRLQDYINNYNKATMGVDKN
ncbi:unnamed protein product [Rhizophagus irregularis]|uniref:Arrestin C-terminal-like domain-containing protein n=1 Tax=Rhizophagus irregularis TaxID=588596 RepID=A0A915ZBP4_9GLOM|nr:unnamed protein product [Rhizophagus irregularis]CAB5186544.1 unnamed protein product [Rhizophagus irregularis]CAB5368850.1 unnamed protein product [Rhizophagus irregularis]